MEQYSPREPFAFAWTAFWQFGAWQILGASHCSAFLCHLVREQPTIRCWYCSADGLPPCGAIYLAISVSSTCLAAERMCLHPIEVLGSHGAKLHHKDKLLRGWWMTGELGLTSQFAPGTVVWGGWLPIAGVQFFNLSLLAQVFPQYGWTFAPSVYLGRRWQNYIRLRNTRHRGRKGRTSHKVLLKFPGLELTEDCPLVVKPGKFIGADGAAETFNRVGCGITGAAWGGGAWEGWFPVSLAANEG